MTVAKRAFNNIFWLFVSEVSSRGLIFLGTIYLARMLGKAGFGLNDKALPATSQLVSRLAFYNCVKIEDPTLESFCENLVFQQPVKFYPKSQY